jgi:hypothetical protein
MADCAWMSVASLDAGIIKPLRSEMSFADDESLQKAYADAGHAAGNGQPIPAEFLPRTVFGWRGRHDSSKPLTGRLPHLCTSDFWFVSSEVADVLRRFDLGGCKLHPVEVLMEDRKTPLPGSYFILEFNSWKDVFVADASPDIAMASGSKTRRRPWLSTPDDAAALSRQALEGADIWWNPNILRTFFLSDRLVQALRAAKVDKPFSLRRCRIV